MFMRNGSLLHPQHNLLSAIDIEVFSVSGNTQPILELKNTAVQSIEQILFK